VGGGGIPIQSTNTADAAGAQIVGEFQSQFVASGSAVTLTTNSSTAICSSSVPPGDWEVRFNPVYLTTATTSVQYLLGSIATTNATAADIGNGQYESVTYADAGVINSLLTNVGFCVGPFRASLAATTTIWGVAQAGFNASTLKVYGGMSVRRVR
jgi:hypothetical protein